MIFNTTIKDGGYAQAGYEGLFRLGVALVCMRLLGIYIEVFGSMLETGLGLIVVITEGIPVLDMMRVKNYLKSKF